MFINRFISQLSKALTIIVPHTYVDYAQEFITGEIIFNARERMRAEWKTRWTYIFIFPFLFFCFLFI